MDPKDLIKKTVSVAKDAIDIRKPVRTRTMNRYKELQELSRAQNTKVMQGARQVWHTYPPKMNISKLQMAIVNGEGIITYDVYKTVTEKNSCIHNEWSEETRKRVMAMGGKGTNHDEVKNVDLGNKWLNEQAEPVVIEMVTEIIKLNKPIKVEKEKAKE